MPFELLVTEKVEKVLAKLEKGDQAKLKRVEKCFAQLEEDPRHPGLSSHGYDEIAGPPLGEKVFESYVENHAPSAWRAWWIYGPSEGQITVVDLGPHP
jgi:hypothetical protein